MKERLSEIRETLLTGISYMLPFVITGGILIALGFTVGGCDTSNSVEEYGDFISAVFWLGEKAFTLMMSVLGVYVAYSIADKPGIAVSMVDSALADMQRSGLFGALIAGITAGCLMNLLEKVNLPMTLKSLLPTLIVLVIGIGITDLITVYVVGTPLPALTAVLTDMPNSLETGNPVLLDIIQGCMLAFGTGGPCNKVTYAFMFAAMDAGDYMSMAANFIGSMAPLLAIMVATLATGNKFAKEERATVPDLFARVFGMITEFAIPFAAANPLTIIPSLMAGSAVGCVLPYVLELIIHVPYGGSFVLFTLNDTLLFIVALLTADTTNAALLILLRKPAVEAEEQERTQDYGKTTWYHREFPP